MSKIHFSGVLFEQIGGVNWQANPNAKVFPPPSYEVAQKQVNKPMPKQLEKPAISSESVMAASDPAAAFMHVVVLGAGLDEVWQNETHQAWQLWQNIMLAFDWDESQIAFFDTAHLVQEEMIFSTIEEVIELGVDWVLCMDDEHIISEQLQEGVHVVSVPDLETMLADPYAKKTFYHAVIALSHAV